MTFVELCRLRVNDILYANTPGSEGRGRVDDVSDTHVTIRWFSWNGNDGFLPFRQSYPLTDTSHFLLVKGVTVDRDYKGTSVTDFAQMVFQRLGDLGECSTRPHRRFFGGFPDTAGIECTLSLWDGTNIDITFKKGDVCRD